MTPFPLALSERAFDRRAALKILAAAIACGSLPPVRAAAQPAPVTPLSLRHDRVFLPARVQGQPVEALLDSAAEMTLIDRRWAEGLGLRAARAVEARGSGGSQPAAFADGVLLEAAGLRLPARTVALTDLQPLSERLLHEPVQVILGRELFDAARWRIDLAAATLQNVGRQARPRGTALPLRTRHGIEALPARVEGHAAWADLDLGNGSDVLLGRDFALRHGLLRPERIVARERGGGLGGEIEREVLVLDHLVLAGRVFEQVRATIDPQPNAGDLNLGPRLLQHFEMTWDFARHRAWLQPR